jgi:predicted transglutaminase-like cysteine proteinase
LVHCVVGDEGHHLVLEVEGWVLDNRYKWVMNRDDLDYKWVRISGYEKGDKWHRIKKD